MKPSLPAITSDGAGRPSVTPRHTLPQGPKRAMGVGPWSPAIRKQTHGKTQPSSPAAGGSPRLRLVTDSAPVEHTPTPDARPNPPTPISGATDPRWVLAVRTAEVLQGDVLPPPQRDRLMKLAKALGLTPFDGCLILAMIQDQARRGLIARHCPAAAEPQLAMVPLPGQRAFFPELRNHPLRIGFMAAGLFALQALLVWIWLS